MKLKFGFYDLFEGSGIDKSVLNWIFGIFVGIIGMIILFTVYSENKRGQCTSSKEAFFQLDYHGKIVRKYRSKNHGYQTVVFEGGVEKSLIFDYSVFEKIAPGDILLKDKNKLNFKLVHGNDTSEYKEHIGDCEQFRAD